jgi:hypothetical protein
VSPNLACFRGNNLATGVLLPLVQAGCRGKFQPHLTNLEETLSRPWISNCFLLVGIVIISPMIVWFELRVAQLCVRL